MAGGAPQTTVHDLPLVCRVGFEVGQLQVGHYFKRGAENPEGADPAPRLRIDDGGERAQGNDPRQLSAATSAATILALVTITPPLVASVSCAPSTVFAFPGLMSVDMTLPDTTCCVSTDFSLALLASNASRSAFGILAKALSVGAKTANGPLALERIEQSSSLERRHQGLEIARSHGAIDDVCSLGGSVSS